MAAQLQHIGKLDTRLSSLLHQADVDPVLMDKLAEKKYVKLQTLAYMGDDRKEVRGMLIKLLGLDPDADENHKFLSNGSFSFWARIQF